MEKLNACPICNSASTAHYLSSKDYFLTQESFQISRCTACTALFTNPRPTESASERYYQSEEYISHSDNTAGMISKMYRLVRARALKKKAGILRKYHKQGKVLDVGSGTGHFIRTLQRYGYDVQGMEPGEAPRNYSVAQFGLNVTSSLSDPALEKKTYNAITLWHVLEHVYPLQSYIKRLKELLNTSGVLVVAVPNPDSYDAKHYKEFWAAYDLPRHLYHFTHDALLELMSMHDFQLIKTLPMKFDGFYVSMLSEKYKTGKTNYIKAFLTGLKSNLMANRQTNNYSSTIYLFKHKIG